MKHVKLFEAFDDSETNDLSYGGNAQVYCINSSGEASAVGMLDPDEEKMLAIYISSNPGNLMVEKFPAGQDGDFILLTGEGEWKFVQSGDTYDPGEGGIVFPILGFGQMFVALGGSQTTFEVMPFKQVLSIL